MTARRGGFTLIELVVVLALIGSLVALVSPRLSAFLAEPPDRDLRNLEHFMIRASRRAVREPVVPVDQPGARPIRIRVVPPKQFQLIRADTELARFELAYYQVEEILRDDKPTAAEPELAFSTMGVLPPFVLKLAGPAVSEKIRWEMDRLGGFRKSEWR